MSANVYIAKPFSIKVLIAQCASLIHLREVMQQSFAAKPSQKAEAPKILKDENLNVSEVAYRVGINYPQYFAMSFKKMFGKSPSEYQKGE